MMALAYLAILSTVITYQGRVVRSYGGRCGS